MDSLFRFPVASKQRGVHGEFDRWFCAQLSLEILQLLCRESYLGKKIFPKWLNEILRHLGYENAVSSIWNLYFTISRQLKYYFHEIDKINVRKANDEGIFVSSFLGLVREAYNLLRLPTKRPTKNFADLRRNFTNYGKINSSTD